MDGAEKLREKFFSNYLAKQTTNLLKILNNAEFAINFFLVVPHYANKAKTLFALTLASVSVYSQKMSVIFMFWSINQFNAHKMNSNSLFMKTSRALRVETQTKKHFIKFAEHV